MRRCRICQAEMPAAAKCTTMICKKRLCSITCAAEWGQKAAITKREREYRKTQAEARERLKTRSDHAREAQQAVNKYIRVRDAGRPCISCGRHHQGQYHAGHYRTTKSAPSIRFNLFNISAQCVPCNSHLSGNVVEYRINLIKRYGLEKVEWLESQNNPRRFDIDYLKRLKRIFNKRARHLERLRESMNNRESIK